MNLGSHRPSRRRRNSTFITLLAGLLLLFAALPAFAQTFDFNLPKGPAAVQLDAWSRITGIRIQRAPGASANLFAGKTTNAIKGRMGPYQALNELLEDTPLFILHEELKVVVLGALDDTVGQLDSDPAIWASDPLAITLQQSLSPAFSPLVIARLVARPASGAPYAVGLRLEGERYSIVATEAPAAIGARNPAVTAASVCQAELDAALGRRVAESWRRVVARNLTRGLPGAGGATYDFAFRQASGIRQRRVWEPASGTPERQLITVGKAMRSYCADASATNKAALARQLSTLEQRLRRIPPGEVIS